MDKVGDDIHHISNGTHHHDEDNEEYHHHFDFGHGVYNEVRNPASAIYSVLID